MQARAMVDKYMCVWLSLRIITYLPEVFESFRYNLMFSLPSLGSSITHTRDTSDKRQLLKDILLRAFFFI